MSFVIVGGGRVGLRTARVLREEGHDVVIVERDPEKVERISDEGFRVVEGDGADGDVLEEAGRAIEAPRSGSRAQSVETSGRLTPPRATQTRNHRRTSSHSMRIASSERREKKILNDRCP